MKFYTKPTGRRSEDTIGRDISRERNDWRIVRSDKGMIAEITLSEQVELREDNKTLQDWLIVWP